MIDNDKYRLFGNQIFNHDILRLTFAIDIFKKMQASNISFKEFDKMLDEYIGARNKIFSIVFSNKDYCLLHKGNLFQLMIVRDNKFFVWCDNGSTSIGDYEIEYDNTPSDEFIEWLKTTLNNCIEGKICCSDCGKQITKAQIAGRYFAGVYCKDCWEREWKAIEAKETYD